MKKRELTEKTYQLFVLELDKIGRQLDDLSNDWELPYLVYVPVNRAYWTLKRAGILADPKELAEELRRAKFVIKKP